MNKILRFTQDDKPVFLKFLVLLNAVKNLVEAISIMNKILRFTQDDKSFF
jgi:hypothetical protein